MYSQVLTAIYIKGFKTFARPVRMPLEGGLTAIVGPNGSGKSNVTDGVLFALGEQSPGLLRAGTMGELIFSGSESLPAASSAEVTLVFDNASAEISLPYAEVSVTRRISRAGETEYRINGSRSRLADVRAVAGEAGLGRHSILRQGAVDAILAGGAAACRQALEEAAGLGVFRRRRVSASRRLERADDQLEKSRQLESELANQLRRIQTEAEAARRYRELESRYRELSLAHLYRVATRELGDLKERLRLSESGVLSLEESEREIRRGGEKIENRLRELAAGLGEASESGRERSRLAAELDRLRARQANLSSDGGGRGLSEEDLAPLRSAVEAVEAGRDERPGDRARDLGIEARRALGRVEPCFEGVSRRRGALAAADGRAESRVRRLRAAEPASEGTRLYEVVRPRPGFEAAVEAALGDHGAGLLAENLDEGVRLLSETDPVALI